jgi:hypothetical protein
MLRHLQWPFTWAVSNTWLRTSSTGLLTVISILDGCLIPFQQVSRTPISQWVFDAASWGLAVLYMLYCARWAMLYCARWATSGFVIDQRRRKKESMWDLICEYIQWLSPYFALYIYCEQMKSNAIFLLLDALNPCYLQTFSIKKASAKSTVFHVAPWAKQSFSRPATKLHACSV